MGTECVCNTSPANFWLFRPSGQSTTTVTTAKNISTTTSVTTSMTAVPSVTAIGNCVGSNSNNATPFNSDTPRVASSLGLLADTSTASSASAEFSTVPSSNKCFAQHPDFRLSFSSSDLLSASDPKTVRLQSDSAPLNSMNVKVPRNVLHEFELCRQQWRCAGSSPSCCTSQTNFFSPKNDIQSDSEGEDSLASSSEEGGSADGIVEQYDDDDDLGVVRDLELYDRDIDTNKSNRFHNQQQQYFMAAGSATTAAASSVGSNATTPLVGSPSSATVVASSTMMAAMAAAAAAAAASAVNIASPSMVTTTASTTANVFNSMHALNKKQLDIDRLTILAEIQGKKAVRFADECGKNLETVRVMTEPSDYPPLINPAVIRRFRKAASLAALVASSDTSQMNSSTANLDDDDDDDDEDALAALKAPRSSWKITFRQPASEYVKFRETLERQKVALENVMLKNDVGRMVGTIKVCNIAFEKRVFLRYTANDWKTYTDRDAIYQSSPSKAHDTFRFDIEIPRDTDTNARIEFCVCFETKGGQTHWDSNEGKNYTLTASDYDQFPSLSSASVPIKEQTLESCSPPSLGFGSPHNVDAYNMNYDNWAKFASWRNLRTDTPYW